MTDGAGPGPGRDCSLPALSEDWEESDTGLGSREEGKERDGRQGMGGHREIGKWDIRLEKADGIMKRECEVSTVQKIRNATTVEKTKVNFNEVTETAEFYSGCGIWNYYC